jgi:hypothetical protein
VCRPYDRVLLLFVEIQRRRDHRLRSRCLFAAILRMTGRACRSSLACLSLYSSQLQRLVCLTFRNELADSCAVAVAFDMTLEGDRNSSDVAHTQSRDSLMEVAHRIVVGRGWSWVLVDLADEVKSWTSAHLEVVIGRRRVLAAVLGGLGIVGIPLCSVVSGSYRFRSVWNR